MVSELQPPNWVWLHHGWSTYPAPGHIPPPEIRVQQGLNKGNQGLISPKHQALISRWVTLGGGLGWSAIIPVLGSEKSCKPLHPTTVLGEALASWFVCWHVRKPHMGAGHFPLIRIESFYWNCSSMTRFKFKPKHCYHQAHWIIDFRTNKTHQVRGKRAFFVFIINCKLYPVEPTAATRVLFPCLD